MKLAFCFMSYGDIEQRRIWSSFFAAANRDQYATFLHRVDGNQETWLPGCVIIPTIPTKWGTFSLVQVQQNLFTEACKDPAVTKCILLSGDSIPIHSFQTIYDKLTRDDKGYMDTTLFQNELSNFISKATRKFTTNLSAWPTSMPWKWGKISQWVVLNRSQVQLLQENWALLVNVFRQSECPDEHIYYIFFNGVNELHNFHTMPVIYVNWVSLSNPCKQKHRALPHTFHSDELRQSIINEIYSSGALFMRKICSDTKILIDWSKNKPLIPTGKETTLNSFIEELKAARSKRMI